MSRDGLMFATGALVALVLELLLSAVELPPWTLLLTAPVALWWLWRIAAAWHARWREWTMSGKGDLDG